MPNGYCIDSGVLGTPKHLYRNNDGFSWVKSVPKGSWYFAGEVSNIGYCIASLAKLNSIELQATIPERYLKASATLFSSGSVSEVPWSKILPRRTHEAFVKGLIERLDGFLASADKRYYEAVWVPGTAVLEALQPTKINLSAFVEALESGNVHVVKTFQPDEDGFAPITEYNRFGTRTGRLTISSGPNIHTLSKENRKILASRYGADGTIVALDFAALEARVLLYEAGKMCDEIDLYKKVAKELNISSRNAVKQAVISEMYGAGKAVLGKALGFSGYKLDEFINTFRGYFMLGGTLSRIKKQFMLDGFVMNRYFRRVQVDEPLDHILLNSYVQSTGADVAMLGFAKLIPEIASKTSSAVPLFSLHDSLIFDIHKDDLESFKTFDSIRVDGYVQPFKLKADVLV